MLKRVKNRLVNQRVILRRESVSRETRCGGERDDAGCHGARGGAGLTLLADDLPLPAGAVVRIGTRGERRGGRVRRAACDRDAVWFDDRAARGDLVRAIR